MEIIHGSVTWYQQKIGSYDKQLWEQSVEQKVLKGIHQAPRRSVKPKTELIDVDLVRGSTYSKAKPQVPWTYITLKTFSRVVLFPFHYRWWIQQTSIPFWVFLLVMYCLQIFTISVFVCNVEEEVFGDEHSLSEVFTPCILMVLLGLIHSQTVLTHLKPPVRDTKRDSWRRKRSLSQNRSGSDLVGSPGNSVGSDGNSSQSKTSLKTPLGSRLLRDRTKDRKVRSKSGTHRTTVKAAETISQDSESAYHTYEESTVDKGSSADQDTVCGTNKKEEEKKKNVTKGTEGGKVCDKVNVDIIPLRESQESDLPEDSNSDEDKESEGDKDNSKRFSQSISSDNDLDMDGIRNVDIDEEGQAQCVNKSRLNAVEKNLIIDNGIKVKELNAKDVNDKDKNKVTKNGMKEKELHTDSVHIDDLNKGSVHNTKDVTDKDKNKVDKIIGMNLVTNHCTKYKGLNTDSINTDELENGSVLNTEDGKQFETVTCSDLSAKERFEGPSRLLKVKWSPVNGIMNKNKLDIITVEDKSDLCDVVSKSVNKPVSNDNKFTLKNLASRKLLNKKKEAHEKKNTFTVANGLRMANDKKSIQSQISDLSSLSSVERGQSPVPAHIASFVHFTLDKKREVTPRSSREGTPTHTQSDVLLQAKHSRGGNLNTKSSDSESEDTEKTCKTLPNVRRRKVTLPDGSEVSGSILRNRRQPLGIRETKSTTTVMSSSEAETEGQSSESRKNMASSEEWGDHLQSGLDSTSESSGTEPELSTQEVPEPESEIEVPAIPVPHSVSSSTAHAINLLHPSSSQSTTHNPPDKVTCIIWEGNNECKKIELTAIDIGWAIIETVHKIPESSDYVLIGITFSIMMGLTPLLYHSFHAKDISSITTWSGLFDVVNVVVQNSWRVNLIHLNGVIQRLCLSAIFFFMLSVADKTFKQRLLYAKHFCYLTSSRRARKFDMPHFRLNKVRNIRTWLSLRSYLKKRGPQRSVDVIVSSSFLITLIMLILICLQLLRDTEIYLNYLCNWELLAWCMALGVYLLRFMNLGLRINKKYRNLSVLITEQINLYLQMEQKPHKKEELMVANNVLKLAESLLKELESPFKISGISANPLVLNVTRVVVLSAFSAVLTELLGFKLKLYKIKLRP